MSESFLYIYIYIKVAVVNVLHSREYWRCGKGLEGLLHVGQVLGRDSPITTMSLQRFLYCNQDGHDNRSRSRQSLVKDRRFRVVTEICSVTIGYFMSQQRVTKTKEPCVVTRQFLCRDRVWSRPEHSMSRQSIYVSRQSLALGRNFMLRHGVFVSRQSLARLGVFLSR